jgi:DNA-directed RNA polymerase beta' subunit
MYKKVSRNKLDEYLKGMPCVPSNNKIILGPKDSVYDRSSEKPRIVPDRINREQKTDLDLIQKRDPLDELAKERHKDVCSKLSKLKKVVATKYCMSCISFEEMKGFSLFPTTSMSTSNESGTFGVFDKRLAPEKRKICLTCNRDYKGCEKHRSYIPLEYPLPNPLFQSTILNICKCICWYCGQVYATEDFIKMSGLDKISDREKYLKELANFTSKIHKLHCHPDYKREIFDDNMKNYLVMFKIEGETKPYSKSMVKIIKAFDNLNDESLKILRFTGKNRPSNLIMQGLITLPPNLHLATLVNGKLMEHFYTSKYISIIDCNIKLRQTQDIHVQGDLLSTQYSKIWEIFFGPVANATMKVSTKDLGICKGFGRKEGTVRRYAQGKRVEQCFRTVANPSVGKYKYVGVPRSYAQILLVPIKVTKYNLHEIKSGILDGSIKHYIQKIDGQTVTKSFDDNSRRNFHVSIGQQFERSLRDGDIILTGRQPSLHGPSLMGYYVYLIDEQVVLVHLSNVGPMNMDFDGDDGTGHVIQTIEAQVEAMTVASTEFHLMNEQSNRVMIGLAFHALFFGYAATKTWKRNGGEFEVEIPKRRMVEALSLIDDSIKKSTLQRRCIRHGVKYYSGRALASVTFPINLTYKKHGIEIIDGILVKGTLSKDTLGTGHNSLIGVICKLFSMEVANEFINDFALLGDWFVMWHGFSMGQQTFVSNRKKILKKMSNYINSIQARFFNLGPLPVDEIDLFFWKKKAHSMLNQGEKNGKDIANEEFDETNGLNVSGSNGSKVKGSAMNIAQIGGCLGCQNIKGDIQEHELNGGTRGLPMFLPGDCSLESVCFIPKSFYDGIDESALYDHLASSREGQVDTANNTKDIGYTHRRIEKAMENTILSSRGIVETVLGKIFQFTYDNINVALEVNVKSPEFGKHLFFCDFQSKADLWNRLYEYIDEHNNIPDEYLNNEETIEIKDDSKLDNDYENIAERIDATERQEVSIF